MSALFSDAFLAHALQTTIAVSALIVLVLFIRRPFAARFGAKAAYALWLLPAVRLVLPPLPPGWSLFGPIMGDSGAAVGAVATPSAIISSNPTLPATFIGNGEPSISAPPVAEAPPSLASSEAGLASGTGWFEAVASFAMPSLLVAWVLGALLMFGWSVYRQTLFAQIISWEAEPASLATQTEVVELCQKIGLDPRRVSIRSSFISDGPLVAGLLHPIILLPAWFEEDYTREERVAAILHELTHVKRHDLWALQAATCLLCLQWFNPLAHRAMAAFRSDQEASCDADVLRAGVSSPHAYGATLVKAVRKSRPVAEPKFAHSLYQGRVIGMGT
ncbi:MAG: M56 family metallopeptidase [Pseudomonadota bacterium]